MQEVKPKACDMVSLELNT